MRNRGGRAVSSVVAVVLMVAVTVILAAAVGSFALQFTDAEQDPAPQVANADAKFLADVAGGSDQTVRITHEGGDAITVSNVEIVVTFADHPERSRLVGAPTDTIGPDDYEGDDIWDGSNRGIGGALASNEPEGSDGEWTASEPIEFRIANGDVSLSAGETVTVTIVHTPSGKVLLERTLTASADSLEPGVDTGTPNVQAGVGNAETRRDLSVAPSDTAGRSPAFGTQAVERVGLAVSRPVLAIA